MKALVFYGPEDCRVVDVEKPKIDSGEVLVRVKYAGVCGTDVRIYKGTKKIDAPRIIGHEFAGDIAEIGAGVTKYSVGERVTVYPVIFCGQCYACRDGRKNICLNRTTLGYQFDGGFAEYVRIPGKAVADGNIVRLPDNVSYEEGATSEPVCAAYNGIVRANIKEGDDIVILGAGPIGLCHTMLSKTKKAGRIIVSEPNAEKRELALEFGADHAIDPTGSSVSLEKEVFKLTNDKGADVVFVDVGRAEVIEGGFALLKKGGTYILFAGCPEGTEITIDPNVIHYKEICFTGASASTPEYLTEVLGLISSKQINVGSLITDVMPLADWEKAIKMKLHYQGSKTLLKI